MDREFSEKFKCPVCWNVPESEIFQCRNGHTICNICIESLKICPVCRVSFGNFLIRSRPLEKILDTAKFDCSFKQEGCPIKVSRKEITNHFNTCRFGGVKVPLCKYLGYTCYHEVNTRKLWETLDHFKQQHQYITTSEKCLNIKLKDIKNLGRQKMCLWKPIVANAFSCYFLLVLGINKHNLFLMAISIGENGNNKVEIKFRIVPPVKSLPSLEWTTKPISYEESELVLKSPPCQFFLNLLMEYYLVQDDLLINVSMSDTNLQNSKQIREFLTIDSLAVLKRSYLRQRLYSSMLHVGCFIGRIFRAVKLRLVKTSYFCFSMLLQHSWLLMNVALLAHLCNPIFKNN